MKKILLIVVICSAVIYIIALCIHLAVFKTIDHYKDIRDFRHDSVFVAPLAMHIDLRTRYENATLKFSRDGRHWNDSMTLQFKGVSVPNFYYRAPDSIIVLTDDDFFRVRTYSKDFKKRI